MAKRRPGGSSARSYSPPSLPIVLHTVHHVSAQPVSRGVRGDESPSIARRAIAASALRFIFRR